MIFTQSVTAYATVAGIDNFKLTSATINRTTGRKAAKAVIKGIPSGSPEQAYIGSNVEIYVEASSVGGDPGDKVQVFGGGVQKVTQNEEGIITIEAYDTRYILLEERVQLEAEEPLYAHQVLVDLIEDTYKDVTQNREEATRFVPYVAPQSEFPAGNYLSDWRIGTRERGEPLIRVVEDLLDTLGGYIYVDKAGVVNFTPYPDGTTEWDIPYITDINSGEETRNKEQVIIEGNTIASDQGAAASRLSEKFSLESRARISGDEDGPDAPTKTISDNNVTSQGEADQRAFNEATRQDQNRDFGSVTIIGNGNIELFDHVIVPELEYTFYGIDEEYVNDVQEGKFKVDAIEHTINNEDGFLTKLSVSPPIEDTYNRIDPLNGEIQVNYLSRYSNSVIQDKVSGKDDDTGFLRNAFSTDAFIPNQNN